MTDILANRFRQALPGGLDFASLRHHRDIEQEFTVRHGNVLPMRSGLDEGAMITVHAGGGTGYAATADLSLSGLKRACRQALHWAEVTARLGLVDTRGMQVSHSQGTFASPVRRPWDQVALADKVVLLQSACKALMGHASIVDSAATLWHTRSHRVHVTDAGGHIEQTFDRLIPMLRATANRGTRTESRTLGGLGWVRQQGLEVLDECRFAESAGEIAADAVMLLDAEDCPTGRMDLLLAPDQMLLQIHESIGHPLELDRILGDERNYAGRSFVTLDMFGDYQYGSQLLNVTFDPTMPEQAASYAFDDDGRQAEKLWLIRDGVLLRPLGGTLSRDRAASQLPGFEGTANSRADSWRRPPIDRMANLNIEPGTSRFEDMVADIERGIHMRTNCSWSIDDSRNKFQFGCEWGQLIENGRLTRIVRKPGYRGISANFWRSLAGVGDRDSLRVLGTPYCGKGEPNQAVFVGHASPACLFRNADVFGAD